MSHVVISSLVKRYGDMVAVDRVTLDIPEGEFLTLLGSSGCGKTTTLRCVAGLESPDEGEIYFDDRPVTQTPAHERSCGMVFQNYALFPHMTVEENLAYGLLAQRYRQADPLGRLGMLFGSVLGSLPAGTRTRIKDALHRVELSDYGQRKPGHLSGGQQQRVALARALITQPRVLLFDEPLGALDAQLRVKMREEVRRIQKEAGITTLYVTHDQEEALAISDRIAVMRRGVIAQLGTPEEIYRQPRSRFVADFIGLANVFSAVYTGPGAARAASSSPASGDGVASSALATLPLTTSSEGAMPAAPEAAAEPPAAEAAAPSSEAIIAVADAQLGSGSGDDRVNTGLSISIRTPGNTASMPLYISGRPTFQGRFCAAIKPENIRFVDPAAPGDGTNRVRGVVTLRMFMGTHVRYVVRCGDFELIVMRPDAATRAAVDEAVTLEFSPHDVLLLEDEA